MQSCRAALMWRTQCAFSDLHVVPFSDSGQLVEKHVSLSPRIIVWYRTNSSLSLCPETFRLARHGHTTDHRNNKAHSTLFSVRISLSFTVYKAFVEADIAADFRLWLNWSVDHDTTWDSALSTAFNYCKASRAVFAGGCSGARSEQLHGDFLLARCQCTTLGYWCASSDAC